MGDDIHKTHFQVPEMPWREKEKLAIILLQRVLMLWDTVANSEFEDAMIEINEFDKELVEWVMKYKGE